MKRHTSQNTALFFLVLALFGAGAVLYGGFMIKRISLEIKTISEEARVKEGKEAEFLKERNLLEETTDARGKIDSYFVVSEEDTVKVLEQIEALGKSHGITPSVTFSVGQSAKTGSEALNFSVTARGTYEEMYTFLLLLENFPGVLDITGVRLSRGNEIVRGGKRVPEWNLLSTFQLISYGKST